MKIIGQGAFRECPNLSSVIFESVSQLTDIQDLAFQDSGLASIVIPASVVNLNSWIFHSYDQLA